MTVFKLVSKRFKLVPTLSFYSFICSRWGAKYANANSNTSGTFE